MEEVSLNDLVRAFSGIQSPQNADIEIDIDPVRNVATKSPYRDLFDGNDLDNFKESLDNDQARIFYVNNDNSNMMDDTLNLRSTALKNYDSLPKQVSALNSNKKNLADDALQNVKNNEQYSNFHQNMMSSQGQLP